VCEIDPNTVLQWLVEATEQLTTFSAYFLHELHVTQIQLDELYAVLSALREGDMSEAEAIEYLSRSPHWVWTAIDPETKLWSRAPIRVASVRPPPAESPATNVALAGAGPVYPWAPSHRNAARASSTAAG
jgi:hypothetical protein